MTKAPAGISTDPERPIAAMRSPVTTMSARSRTSSPFMVMARALFRTTEPFGRGFCTTRDTGIASGFGISGVVASSPPLAEPPLPSLPSPAFSFSFSASVFFRIASRTRSKPWR